MKRTTVMFDEATYASLQEIARRKGTTSSLLIREAVGQYVASASQEEGSPLENLIGIFEGPGGEWASRADEAFGEIVLEKHARIQRDHEHR